jgi:hypothetical protein
MKERKKENMIERKKDWNKLRKVNKGKKRM